MTLKRDSALALFWTDYLAHCRGKDPEAAHLEGPQSTRQLALMLVPRLIINPGLQAVLALRLANASPRLAWGLWRNYFVHWHSMDWVGPLEIGPGFRLPHPLGTCLAPGMKIGSNVGVAHNVTLAGAADDELPVLGDRVLLYPGVVIFGGVELGEGSVVSANCVVTRDVAPDKLVTQNGVIPVAASPRIRAFQAAAAAIAE